MIKLKWAGPGPYQWAGLKPSPSQLVTVHEHSNQLRLQRRARPTWRRKRRRFKDKERGEQSVYLARWRCRWCCWRRRHGGRRFSSPSSFVFSLFLLFLFFFSLFFSSLLSSLSPLLCSLSLSSSLLSPFLLLPPLFPFYLLFFSFLPCFYRQKNKGDKRWGGHCWPPLHYPSGRQKYASG